jgi:hypothetical protein
MDKTIALPMPHRGQQAVRRTMQRFNWLCAGRRWRKTTLAMTVALEEALRGKQVVWGAPTFDQVRVGWKEAKRAAAGVLRFHETQMRVETPSGGAIIYRSFDDPDNARGHTADGVIIDEAADVVEEGWTEVLRPMLVDTGGWLLALGTPKGRNWFWRECMRAPERDEAISWQAPTLGAQVIDGQLVRVPHPLENPEIAWGELVDIFTGIPERVFRQEILAEFLENAGGVFRNVRACVAGQLEERPSHPARQYVMGVDLAKHADYTVCCVGDMTDRRVVAYDRYNQADWGLQKTRIIQMAHHWNNALVWLDATGVGDPIYDDLRAAGLRIHPYKFTSASKTTLINNAVLMVEQQEVHYPEIAALISELSSYEYERLPAGGLRMNAPAGMHDDFVVAFSLMCWPLAHHAPGLAPQALEQLRGSETEIGGVRIMRKVF